jgi:hypothetical protein
MTNKSECSAQATVKAFPTRHQTLKTDKRCVRNMLCNMLLKHGPKP